MYRKTGDGEQIMGSVNVASSCACKQWALAKYLLCALLVKSARLNATAYHSLIDAHTATWAHGHTDTCVQKLVTYS